MSVQILHRSRSRTSFIRIPWFSNKFHARSSQQGQGFRSLSCLRKSENFFVLYLTLYLYKIYSQMYQWKLLNHVSRDHHMTLKPAHLSYKCTVCTATFGMYKQFETHVYTAHSTVAKKQLDGKKNSSSSGSSARSSSTNDNLLKPLKINDEITIIPQPSSKATRTIDIGRFFFIGKYFQSNILTFSSSHRLNIDVQRKDAKT